MRKKLGTDELMQALGELPRWKLEHGALVRDWTFADFKQAMKFTNQIAALAEADDHHPDIDIRYNRVRLSFVTHDVGAITRKDVEMSQKVDAALDAQK